MKNDEEWQEVLLRVRSFKDARGRGLDKGIEETVAILQLLGLHTTMSCFGHLKRYTGGPYVVFAHPDIGELREVYGQIGDPADRRAKHILFEAKRLSYVERDKVWQYLEEFYEDRRLPFRYRLIIEAHPFFNKLYFQGVVDAPFLESARQTNDLRVYQDEMARFTEYLKLRYFSSEKPPSAEPRGGWRGYLKSSHPQSGHGTMSSP